MTLSALALLLVLATTASATTGLASGSAPDSITSIGDAAGTDAPDGGVQNDMAGAEATMAAMQSGTTTTPRRTIKLQTVTVAAPNNAAVWIIPFYNAVYASQSDCQDALPSVDSATKTLQVQNLSEGSCMKVGNVPYTFNVGQTEVTVTQWVAFLNTVDPFGANRHHLWNRTESSTAWPLYGSVNRTMSAAPGQRYSVASSAWANKPYNMATFLRAARFVNSLQNGRVLSRTTQSVTTVNGATLKTTTYSVRLSRVTETGMYTLSNRRATRNTTKGFAVTSQNEWMKAAYFDPKGGGQNSYWDYPTGPGVFVNCGASTCPDSPPASSVLDPTTGNVTNAGTQPLATFQSAAQASTTPLTAPYWCPAQFTPTQCATSPFKNAPVNYVGNVSTVGQAKTRSPWGTLDQGGNVVEITDTIAPPTQANKNKIVWRRWHGGVVTATDYQMWLSAVGATPQTIPGYSINPWRGLRVSVIGNVAAGGLGGAGGNGGAGATSK